MERNWKNFKLDPNKVYKRIGQAVVYGSLYIGSIVFCYWGFLQRNDLLEKGGNKMLILGLMTGLVLGALLMNLVVEEQQRVNELLKKTINNLEENLDNANSRFENRDNLINDLQEENVILLENSSELRSKIEDLENNIEILTNNLTEKNKELISDYQSQN